MKKIIPTFILFWASIANANISHRVCGPDTIGRDYAYTAAVTQENKHMASWAVGDNCGGYAQTDNPDVATMCANVITGGQAWCGNMSWTSSDLNEETAAHGDHCVCRRTKMLANGELRDSIGQWIILGRLGDACSTECAKYCAENVANNTGGMHNAIMILPEI